MVASDPVIVRSNGLVLREWQDRDVPFMVAMFDTAEMDRWTPLAHPFDREEATAYVRRAQETRSRGTLQLAITEDGEEPLGEVLLFPTEVEATCELAYAIGLAHRGRGLAVRAVHMVLSLAQSEGYGAARLMIAVDNTPSQRVARAAGFHLAPEPLQRRERKGHVLDMATWTRAI